MKPLKLLFCLTCFFLDVHVRAEERCTRVPCVLNAKSHAFKLGRPKVVLGKGGLAELRDNEVFHLIRGTAYVGGEAAFSTPYAKLRCEGDCVGILVRRSDRILLMNLKGHWVIERNGESQAYYLPPGMQVTVRETGPDGRAQMDFPQSVPWNPSLRTWARLFPGSTESFRELVAEFRPVWKEAVEAVSGLHLQTAGREIASHLKSEAAERARRLAREKEDAELRELFRRKNFPDQ